jgi:hypothetical protein
MSMISFERARKAISSSLFSYRSSARMSLASRISARGKASRICM